jgi:hypothetical protein
VPFVVSGVITLFLVIIVSLSFLLWGVYKGPEDLRTYFSISAGLFLLIYLILTGFYLYNGYRIGRQVKSSIKTKLNL